MCYSCEFVVKLINIWKEEKKLANLLTNLTKTILQVVLFFFSFVCVFSVLSLCYNRIVRYKYLSCCFYSIIHII